MRNPETRRFDRPALLLVVLGWCLTAAATPLLGQWHQAVTGDEAAAARVVSYRSADDSVAIYHAGYFEGEVTIGDEDYISTGASRDLYVAKFDETGTVLWVKTVGNGDDLSLDDLEIDSQGRLYLGGRFKGSLQFGDDAGTINSDSSSREDLYLVRLVENPAGGDPRWDWAKRFGALHNVEDFGAKSGEDRMGGIALNESGEEVYVVGTFEGYLRSSSNSLIYYQGHDNGSHIAYTAAMDGVGAVEPLGGQFYGAAICNVFLSFCTPIGVGASEFNAATADSAGNLIVVGRFDDELSLPPKSTTSTTDNRSFRAKFNPDQDEWQWLVRNGQGAAGTHFEDLIIGADGDIYLVGQSFGDVTFEVDNDGCAGNNSQQNLDAGIHVARLRDEGDRECFVWVKGADLEAPNDEYEARTLGLTSVELTGDSGGSVDGLYVTGWYDDDLTFRIDGEDVELNDSQGRDAFAATIEIRDTSGKWLSAERAYGNENQQGRSVALTRPGVVDSAAVVVGLFKDEVRFPGPSPKINAQSNDNQNFLARFDRFGNWVSTGSWNVGQAVPRPGGASDCAAPATEVLDDPAAAPPSGDQPSPDYFYWDGAEYYPVRPGRAVLTWLQDDGDCDAPGPVTDGVVEWPGGNQLHAPGAAVYVAEGLSAGDSFEQVHYSEGDGAQVSGIFNNSVADTRSTLRYTIGGATTFEVVETVPAVELPLASGIKECEVGEWLEFGGHDDPGGGEPFVLSPTAPFDPEIHDRATRFGGLFAVNTYDPATSSDTSFEVARFAPNALGVGWPVDRKAVDCDWPSTPLKIVVDAQLGSEFGGQPAFDPETFPAAQVYFQNNPAVAGYNPNDEHALMAPTAVLEQVVSFGVVDFHAATREITVAGGFERLIGLGFQTLEVSGTTDGDNDGSYTIAAVTTDTVQVEEDLVDAISAATLVFSRQPAAELAAYALRSEGTAESEPFVLVKYQDAASGAGWAYNIYEVCVSSDGTSCETGSGVGLSFPVVAGQPVPRPTPLQFMTGCEDTEAVDVVGTPFWRDVRGGVWARADGEMDVTWTYPLLPSFVWPPDPNAECLGWITDTGGDPLPVNYVADWPSGIGKLLIGDTLMDPQEGLPAIRGQAAAEVIFEGDEQAPSAGYSPITLVKALDVLVTRWVATTLEFPAEVLEDAPAYLEDRLEWDPVSVPPQLGFKGLDGLGSEEPNAVLLNVMLPGERDELLELSEESVYEDAIEALYDLTRDPLDLSDTCAEASGDLALGLQDADGDEDCEPLNLLGALGGALSAGAASGEGFVTVAFNNDLSLDPGLPLTLEIFKVGCNGAGEPFAGSLQKMPSANVFDERLTFRHSGDFGGEADLYSFDWFKKPAPYDADTDGTPPGSPWVPVVGSDSNLLTLEGASSETVGDGYFFAQYKNGPANTICSLPDWAGEACEDCPRAKLAEGWIKRVVRALNPFQTRSTDFHEAPANTYASMLIQAGKPYRGPIPFNGDPENVNSIGLIEAYETVLRRGVLLALENDPCPVGEPLCDAALAANNALLLAAGRIADLQMVLGNEAWVDATDPTIGFGTQSGQFGSLAPTIFAFENQLPTLLDEELVLLRGRDDVGTPVDTFPQYNRLPWNFTSGNGEVAYSQTYNISDQNEDGVLDEGDGAIQFPQAHGDAWGHYLTALKSYYRLMRHPEYEWSARAEAVSVAGGAVSVDYRDERKFALAASAKAKAGAEITELTYRQEYVEDPAGQWQGYKDADPERAWGVDDWARRAGQGAYFDWVVANAILPDVWVEPGAASCEFDGAEEFPGEECPPPPPECADPPDCTNVDPLAKIDRTTVPAIGEIVCNYDDIQSQLDEADAGLNPLGLAKNVVPFDIDPAEVDAGNTHYEQIQDRADKALGNTVALFDHANELTQILRRNEDALEDFQSNVGDQDQDHVNRLIEIFGYPYEDDIGGGKLYPIGYEGPDIYHYMYVEPNGLLEAAEQPQILQGKFKAIPNLGFIPLLDELFETTIDEFEEEVVIVDFELDPNNLAQPRPDTFTGRRRAPGELQRALSDYLQNVAAHEVALLEYDNLLADIEDGAELLEAQQDVNAAEIEILNAQLGTVSDLNQKILDAHIAQLAFENISALTTTVAEIAAEALPDVVGLSNDPSSQMKAIILGGALQYTLPLDLTAAGLESAQQDWEQAKEEAELSSAIELEVLSDDLEILQAVAELEQLVRQEPILRLAIYSATEVVAQSIGDFQVTLADGLDVLEELAAFRASVAAEVQEYRYQDMAFRIARNDALQKYRAQFDLAARYAYLAATAYDYETNLLGSDAGAGQEFLTDIVKHRTLGEVLPSGPVAGSLGLADPMARLKLNFEVLEGQLGFNNPQTETNRFSVRHELLRLLPEGEGEGQPGDDDAWQAELRRYFVCNLWDLPEFRRYARPFAPEPPPQQSNDDPCPEPGLVLGYEGNGGSPIVTEVTAGKNYFGWPLGGGDSAYDPTHFATKVRSVGVWFENYDTTGLTQTPRVYLIPVGEDVLRTPSANDFSIRNWSVIDQVLPVPFPVGVNDLNDPEWIPINDTLSSTLGEVRRFSTFRAYHDPGGFDPAETTTESRLIGRSVWNNRWLLIIPGRLLANDPEAALDIFIGDEGGEGVTDIRFFFQTYAYSGN